MKRCALTTCNGWFQGMGLCCSVSHQTDLEQRNQQSTRQAKGCRDCPSPHASRLVTQMCVECRQVFAACCQADNLPLCTKATDGWGSLHHQLRPIINRHQPSSLPATRRA